jgi:transposase
MLISPRSILIVSGVCGAPFPSGGGKVIVGADEGSGTCRFQSISICRSRFGGWKCSRARGRRRSWSAAEKGAIIPESYGAGETVCSERLRQMIKELQRHRFGRRAETLSAEQLQLGLEDVEQVEAAGHAGSEANVPAERQERAARRRANRGALPVHLPRLETLVDIASKICPGCSGQLHRIGEDVAERLDIVPAQFHVVVVRRPKYACRTCEDVVVQALARLIEGGLPTEAMVAQVLVSKYADHLPLYRQAQMYARQGVNLDRSTLADWVGRAAFLLRPIYERRSIG